MGTLIEFMYIAFVQCIADSEINNEQIWLNHKYSQASRQFSYGINVGVERNTAFVIWNGEFVQGDYQYNNKMVLKIYLNLQNNSRLEWMDSEVRVWTTGRAESLL